MPTLPRRLSTHSAAWRSRDNWSMALPVERRLLRFDDVAEPVAPVARTKLLQPLVGPGFRQSGQRRCCLGIPVTRAGLQIGLRFSLGRVGGLRPGFTEFRLTCGILRIDRALGGEILQRDIAAASQVCKAFSPIAVREAQVSAERQVGLGIVRRFGQRAPGLIGRIPLLLERGQRPCCDRRPF